jgi:hypothetical protein
MEKSLAGTFFLRFIATKRGKTFPSCLSTRENFSAAHSAIQRAQKLFIMWKQKLKISRNKNQQNCAPGGNRELHKNPLVPSMLENKEGKVEHCARREIAVRR